MVYFIINGVVIADENYPSEEFYPTNTITTLTQSQYNFYLANPTASVEEILNEQLDPIPVPSFQDLQAQKTEEILTEFQNAISNGYYDSELGITIRITDEDRNQFNQLITLLSLIPDEQKPETTIITDINNVSQEISLIDFFNLMVRMGIYYNQFLWIKKSNLIDQIQNATTEEELDNIEW